MLQKPQWMPREQWADACKSLDISQCKQCGATERLSFDHIIPRWQGGQNAVSNYQVLCVSCNSRKGPRHDKYWSQRDFYWDMGKKVNLDCFRTAQRREAFERVLDHAAYFCQPWSQCSGRMYLLAWIVGAGKTLAIPALAWGLNYVAQRENGMSCPRIDRVLVLVKEQAIRDQIAKDIAEDVLAYGICKSAPKVGRIIDGAMYDHQPQLDSKDVWVSCIQQLYEKNGQPRKDLARILAHFPLIVFDEPHYALEQALRIVETATQSLCFGLTGTPIKANGVAVRRFVLFSAYDYQDAVTYDQSLKFVSNDQKHWRDLVEVIDIEGAEVLLAGQEIPVEDSSSPDYHKNLVPARSVIERVVLYVKDCDKPQSTVPAPHRTPDVLATLQYPVHALIVADSIPSALMLQSLLNDKFQQDEYSYPRNMGFRAEVVHSERGKVNGEWIEAKPLTPSHPWMRYKNTGKLDAQCSRFLVVVGIGREGVNNPACAVVGQAAATNSVVEVVQRMIGRQLRTFVHAESPGMFPPAHLDRIRIITHESFNIDASIQRGIDFVTNMLDHLEDIPTMEDLQSGAIDSVTGAIDLETTLPLKERLELVAEVGKKRTEGKEPVVDEIVAQFPPCSEGKRERMKEWVSSVIKTPEKAWRDLWHDRDIQPVTIVLREYQRVAASDDTLRHHIKTHHPELARELADFERVRSWAQALWEQHVRQCHVGAFRPFTTLQHIHRELSGDIYQQLGRYFSGGTQKERNEIFYILIWTAMRLKLDVQRGEHLNTNGKYDIPQAHAVLYRPDVRREMMGWVRASLIRSGFCPALQQAFEGVIETERSWLDMAEDFSAWDD